MTDDYVTCPHCGVIAPSDDFPLDYDLISEIEEVSGFVGYVLVCPSCDRSFSTV